MFLFARIVYNTLVSLKLKKMERWVGKVAIVTGSSSGIGAAIASSLTNAGMMVVGLARRVDNVHHLSEKLQKKGAVGTLYPMKCDMQIESDVLNVFEWTTKNIGNIHVLVNNAGINAKTSLSGGCAAEWHRIINTNIIGLCVATREAVKIMKENKIEGHIIHINSIVGKTHIYHPLIGVYGASKHAVTNLTEILRQEMVAQKTNIKVTSVCPGMVRTGFLNADRIKTVLGDRASSSLDSIPILEPQDIADGVVYVLGVPHRVQINELILTPLNSAF